VWKGRETGGLTKLCVSLFVREGQEGVEGHSPAGGVQDKGNGEAGGLAAFGKFSE
jgi:hypothetical protein